MFEGGYALVIWFNHPQVAKWGWPKPPPMGLTPNGQGVAPFKKKIIN